MTERGRPADSSGSARTPDGGSAGPTVRVLHCTLDYAPRAAGGAEHQAQLLAEELSARGHVVQVVCPRKGREGSGRVGGIRVSRLWHVNRRPLQAVTASASLAWFLLRHAGSFDVVHVHIADARADVAALVCRLRRRPLYVKVGSGGPLGEIGADPISRVTHHYGLRHAACVQAISEEIGAQLAGLRLDPKRIAAIPNGFDPAVFHPASDSERTALRRTLGLPEDRPIVLFVGRFARSKGLAELLAAWSRVAARFDTAECVLAGFVPYNDPYPIPDGVERVTVRAWTSQPELLYRAADIFVQPSHVEGMSNALLEAMASGLAVVATTVGAAPQMVKDGVDGLLVPPGDSDALAEGLMRLLGDAELRRSMGSQAGDHVRRRYSMSAVVDQIEARYAVVSSH